MQALENEFENYLNDVRGLKTGRLSIGSNNAFSALVLPQIISEFNRLYPGVEVRLTEGNIYYLEELLARGEVSWCWTTTRWTKRFTKRSTLHRAPAAGCPHRRKNAARWRAEPSGHSAWPAPAGGCSRRLDRPVPGQQLHCPAAWQRHPHPDGSALQNRPGLCRTSSWRWTSSPPPTTSSAATWA